jgi:hypothetical protein
MSGTHEEAFIVRVQVPNSMDTEQTQRELEHSIEFGSVSVTPLRPMRSGDFFLW